MTTRSRTPAAWKVLIASACLVMTTACTGAIEDIANQQLEDQGVSVDLDGGSVTVENADGTTTTAGVGIPDDFPDDFPIPDGAESFASASNVGGFAQTVTFSVKGQTVEDLASFYESALPAAGYDIAETAGGSENVVYVLADGAGQVVVNPGAASIGTQVAISLAE